MCRLAGLVADPAAPAVPLSSLLVDAPHSLEQQATAPREQRWGAVNVDGSGLAWWADDAPDALRYVTDKPVWADPNLPALSRRLSATLQLAHVRAASPGIPYGTNFAQPFVYGRLAAAHNGWIGEFRTRTARRLLESLPDEVYAAYHGASDSLALFLLVVAGLQAQPQDGLPGAVAMAVAQVEQVCREAGTAATLNLVVGDGHRLVATRAAIGVPANSLYLLDHGERWADAIVVASEPLDDDHRWAAVPPGSLVEIAPGAFSIRLLPELAGVC